MRNAHITGLDGKWVCELLDDTGALLTGFLGTSDEVDSFIARQEEATCVMVDERKGCDSCERLKIKLAIELDRVEGLQDTVDFYKRAFYIEFARTTPLTSAVSNVKLTATKGEQV